MRRDRAAWVALLAVAMAGCSPDFAAVLHVTIDGPELSPGAGYWVDLRQPDGAVLGAVEPTFVAFKPGKQDVSLILEDGSVFQGSSTFVARLFVGAAPGEDAADIARGSVLVTLKRDEVVEATVELRDDPRPLQADVVVTYDAGAAAFADERLMLEIAALPAGGNFVYHLWLEDEAGGLVWLSALDPSTGSVAIDPRAEAATVELAGVQLLITAEPVDSPEPLVASSGWPILRGGLSAELSRALFAAPGAPLGVFAAAFAVLGVVEQHGGLALDASDAGTNASVRAHGEHVYALVAGEAAASQGMVGDLDGNGSISFVFEDHSGLGHGVVPDAPGYLHLIDEMLSRLEADGANVGLLDGCRANFAAGVADTLATVEALTLLPTDDAAEIAFDCALKRMRGDDTVPTRGACSIGPALECAWQAAETFAGFSLAAVAVGAP